MNLFDYKLRREAKTTPRKRERVCNFFVLLVTNQAKNWSDSRDMIKFSTTQKS